jgi:hypothetical protein
VNETSGKMSIIAAELADYGSYQCFANNELLRGHIWDKENVAF